VENPVQVIGDLKRGAFEPLCPGSKNDITAAAGMIFGEERHDILRAILAIAIHHYYAPAGYVLADVNQSYGNRSLVPKIAPEPENFDRTQIGEFTVDSGRAFD
jgi:hypothetical protein